MLQQLVPEGRTHRLAPLVAGMLQYASDMAYQNYGDNPDEGSVAHVLVEASDVYDPAEAKELSELGRIRRRHAYVKSKRISQ